ncbi:MAG: lipoprotein-releasing system ATP-binding protein [Blastocatellia bacterium]|jgi:lipoprotein-releasing system ATP-binding protein|nr:lipoprotein-releasing system ATP-binding protein [Blastocatellia bacterium]
MSNVQRPLELVEATLDDAASAPATEEGFGHSTLDIGRSDIRLTVKGLSKSFQSPDGKLIEVLRGVSFRIGPGETVAVTGASGAGKSTLLHLLGGLEDAGEGRIMFGEADLTQCSPGVMARIRNETIGFVFQFHHLLPDLTAAENVAMPLFISRASRTESMARALALLASLGLSDRAAHPVRQLSGGEQQRVAVARALVKRPTLVLADEPTGNLDNETGNEIAEVLLSYARSQQALVIIATHLKTLAGRCHRTLVLSEGKLTLG